MQQNARAILRRRPIGAEVIGEGAHFRAWAPRCETLSVVIGESAAESTEIALEPEESGYFSGFVPGACEGTLYRFRLDRGSQLFPDPASRFQPQGPHGPSAVIDPSLYVWRYPPPPLEGKEQVLYEVHIGTFTHEGTFSAASARLPWLFQLGITTIEVMPIADFPGAFGWGYDGVDLWAPTRLYGTPDDFRGFIDSAHAAGLAVILDVVYNHLGPDGNYLKQFSDSYFTDRYPNDWGQAINFDGQDASPVREFFRENAAYWIDEYHLDGLRLDATQSIVDLSDHHILAEITSAARAAASDRSLFIVAENEEQKVRLLGTVEEGGYGVTAMWNDDFHHAAVVALTGRREAYYTDYGGTPQEFVSAAQWGFLYQGQRYKWQKQRRGTDSRRVPAERFVWFLENHDQVANSAHGYRLHALSSPGRMRAMTALLLLGPATPMLFQGQEFGSSAPFLYFADHEPELAAAVARGRRQFLRQFPSFATDETQRILAPPHDRRTFERCKLDDRERDEHAPAVALHRDLLLLRRSLPALTARHSERVHGAVLSDRCFLLRTFADDDRDWLLIVNLGADVHLDSAPEPLLAPPKWRRWNLIWSSEAPAYGGAGAPMPESTENWRINAESALVLEAREHRGSHENSE
jgi:maltooligosyltrehalose trehalohydrolase